MNRFKQIQERVQLGGFVMSVINFRITMKLRFVFI